MDGSGTEQQRDAERIRHVLALARAVNSARHLGELLQAASRHLADALDFDEAYLLLEEGDSFRVFVIAPVSLMQQELVIPASGAPLTTKVLRGGHPLLLGDMTEPETARRYHSRVWDPDPESPNPMHAYMAVPVRAEPVSGVLTVQSSRPGLYDASDLDDFATLGELIGAALQRVRWQDHADMLQRVAQLGRHIQEGDFFRALVETARSAWKGTDGALWENHRNAWVERAEQTGSVDAALAGLLAEQDSPSFFNSYEDMPEALRGQMEARTCPTALVVPLRASAFKGVVAVGGATGFTQWDLEQARFMARELEPYLENLVLYRKLEEEAIRDPLTGAFNRRYFMLKAAEALSQAKRYEQKLGLLMVDLQRFSDVNNTYGHQAGDRVLVEVARCFQESLRDSDLFFRVGGDEFVLLLPYADRAAAAQAANRCAEQLAAQPELSRYSVRANIGYAIYPEDGTDMDALWEAGDHRMYVAKAAGQAVYAPSEPPAAK